MQPASNVAAIVLNWNGWKDTVVCLESLLSLDQDVSVFICDNASTDQSVHEICRWIEIFLPEHNNRRILKNQRPVVFSRFNANDQPQAVSPGEANVPTVNVIETGANLGFAGGNNVGIRYALANDFQYFWILNNDTTVTPSSLTPLLKRMEDPKIGICGSTLVYLDRPQIVQTLGGGGFNRLKGLAYAIGFGRSLSEPIDRKAVEDEMRFVSGASMLVSRAFLDEVGLMQDDYFLYFEELDWAERAKQKRFRLGYAPESVVHHKVGASIGTDDFKEPSIFAEYFFVKNRFRFCWRFSPISLAFVAADTARNVLRCCARRNWLRAWTVACATFGLPSPVVKR